MKLACFLVGCCVSTFAFAECEPASYHYALTGKADGEMIKTISCEDQEHMMTINAKTNVSKFGHKVAVEQTVMGSYASDQFIPTLSTLKDSRENDGQPVDVKLNQGEYDTLSLVYTLEQDLSQGSALPTTVKVLQEDEIETFHLVQENNVELDTALGKLNTTKITLSDEKDVLTYWFAPLEEGRYTMVQSDITDDGDRVFLAKLQA